jgi:phage terminase large subunit
MMEKARRAKQKKEKLLAQESVYASELPLTFKEVPSLVLNTDHVLSDLMYKKATYKIYWGGRGSAKSWGIAEALIRIAAARSVRILCIREFQNSIKDSSHKLLKDTIERLGLQSWFHVTADSIKSRSGAEFIFKGAHLNEQGMRSTEGIDITWVEEGQSFTASSWAALPATVLRNDDCEIWVSFNMVTEQDATYRRFVNEDGTAKRVNSIVHKLNYYDNPYFGGKMREEMEEDKKNDYDLYEHIWLGMPQKKSSAIVFNGKYRVADFPDDLETYAERLYYGADFGFANDPNTLTRGFIIDNQTRPTGDLVPDGKVGKRTLYVTHAAFGYHVDLDNMPAFYDQVPGSRDWPIKADASRPETISHLGRKGFAISAAEKWDGSVKDGITHLRGFDEIVIHTRCQTGRMDQPGLAEEMYLYRYKTDPKAVDEKGQPLVLPVLVDKHQHGIDALRYSLDGYIMRSGSVGMWERLGRAA